MTRSTPQLLGISPGGVAAQAVDGAAACRSAACAACRRATSCHEDGLTMLVMYQLWLVRVTFCQLIMLVVCMYIYYYYTYCINICYVTCIPLINVSSCQLMLVDLVASHTIGLIAIELIG